MISKAQLRALQSLCGRVFGGEADPRQARLDWASAQLGRAVASFRDLTFTDAVTLIGELKRSFGQADNPQRRRPSREVAHALGTHGRRGHVVDIAVMASPTDLAVIDDLRDQFGWTPEQFESWLRSPSSPLRGRAHATIRTLADANKVRWGLQALLRRRRAG